jgi:hypothetical protein
VEKNEYLDTTNKFKKGNPGRKPGTPNKFRQEINNYLKDSFPEFLEWMKELKPKERVDAYLSLLPYGISRLQSVSVTDADGNDIPEQRTFTDFSKLSERTLKEILSHTTNGNDTEN